MKSDQVESMCWKRFGVSEIDVPIENPPIPERMKLDNVYKKLLMRMNKIETKETN